MSCAVCPTKSKCIAKNVKGENTLTFDSIVNVRYPLPDKCSERLILRPSRLHIIQKGAVKLIRRFGLFEEELVGFYCPGEIISPTTLDEFGGEFSIVSIMDTHICEVSFDRLSQLAEKHVAITLDYFARLSQILKLENQRIRTMARKSPASKLAHFLADMTERLSVQEAASFALPFPLDIADLALYLGESTEDLDQAFKAFAQQNILVRSNEMIIIQHMGKLFEFTGRSQGCKARASRSSS